MANAINVTITAKDLASGKIKGVGRSAQGTADKLRGMRGQFLGVAAAGAAVVGALGLALSSFAKTGDLIQKMALRTGFTTEALSEMKFALEQSGSSIEGFEKSVRRMSSFIQDGRDGLTETTRAMDSLGLSVEDFEGAKPEEAFDILATALAGVDDKITQAALAQDIFGRSGTALLPLLAQGKDGIAALREEAHELGIVFDEEAAEKAARLVDAQNTLKKSMDGLKFAMAEGLAPVIAGFAETLGVVVSKISNFAEKNPGLTKTIVILSGVLGTLALIIGTIGLALPIVITGIGGLSVVTGILTGMTWASVAAFIAANIATAGIVVAIAAVVVGIILLIKNWDLVVHAVKVGVNFLLGFIETLVNTWLLQFNILIKAFNAVGGAFGIHIDEIKVNFGRIDTTVEATAETVEGASEDIAGSLDDIDENVETTAGGFEGASGDIAGSLGDIDENVIGTADTIEQSNEAIMDSLGMLMDVYVETADVVEKQTARWSDATLALADDLRAFGAEATRISLQNLSNEQLLAANRVTIAEQEAADKIAIQNKRADEIGRIIEEEGRIRANTTEFRMDLRDKEIAHQKDADKESLESQKQTSDANVALHWDEAEHLYQINQQVAESQKQISEDSNEQVEKDSIFRRGVRKDELVDTLDLLELERLALDAIARQAAADFAKVRAAVERLPSRISVAGGIDPGAGDVAQMFKASQRSVVDDLAAARLALTAGQAGRLGGGTTVAMLQNEVAHLEELISGPAFKGGRLGALVYTATPGGPPPMLGGMSYYQGPRVGDDKRRAFLKAELEQFQMNLVNRIEFHVNVDGTVTDEYVAKIGNAFTSAQQNGHDFFSLAGETG